MKKLIGFMILLVMISSLFAEEIVINQNDFQVNLLASDDNSTVIEYVVGSFEREELTINNETLFKIALANEVNSFEKGAPALPMITRSIIIPDGTQMEINVVESEYIEFSMKVAPSKGILSRQINPEDVPYETSEVYDENAFYPQSQAQLGDAYIMRDFRGVTVTAHPFMYNPQTEVLRVYTHLIIEVTNNGTGIVNTKERTDTKVNREFTQIYKNHFLNYNNNLRYDTVEERGRIVVISYNDFIDTVRPYANWKIQKGYQCDIYDVSIIGNNASSISSFIQSEYDANDGLAYVILVGDHTQVVPKNVKQDPAYSLLEGNDSYPEIFISRFSAETVAQLETQIERTIYYERDITDGEWLHKGTSIASQQGGGSQGDNGESDNQHEDLIRQKLLDYTYTEIDQLYDYDATAQDGVNALNEGRSIVNYTGHGYMNGWGNGADMDISDVNTLTNDNMLPYVLSVACNVGEFQSGTCFGEAWLRATNNSTGLPTGAIAFYGSTISQSWDPPMRAQDHAVDLLVGYDYSTDQPIEQKFSIGGLYFNGSCNMMDVYNSSGIEEFLNWTIFGDASLLVKTDTPVEMSINNNPNLFIGLTEYLVETDTEGALVCISYDDQILGADYTDASGNVTLNLTNVPINPTDLILTITAPNKTTHIQNIQLIPNDGPYVMMKNVTPLAGDDDYIEAGESVSLSLQLENIGSETATNVVVTIVSDDPLITFTDNEETIGNINTNTISYDNDIFAFDLSSTTPDAHELNFTLNIVSDENTWDQNFTLMAYEANVFSVNPNNFYVELGLDETSYDVLSISNTSYRVVDYTIRTEESTGREMTGSYVVCNTEDFEPGETVDWTFTAYNISPDGEWCSDVNIIFPQGITVNSATDMTGAVGGTMPFDGTLGNGVTINWHGATALGYGFLHDNQAATATVNVTITTEIAGNLNLGFEMVGDGYGNDPHIATGDIALSYPLGWISLASSVGSMNENETDDIDVTFSSSNLEPGSYYCNIVISDTESRDYKIVPVSLIVSATDFDDNEIPQVNTLIGNYPNPFNPRTTIAFSVDKDIMSANLDIYNSRGQKIRSFLVDTSSNLQRYEIDWDGTDDQQNSVGSGIYFTKLKTGKFTSTKKMILMK